MAYVFKLPPTVTEEIMRYAVGYPRDRLRAIAAGVVRTEISKPWWKTQVRWSGAGLVRWGIVRQFCLTWHNRDGFEGLPFDMNQLERDRNYEMQCLQEECDQCEPYSLHLQRTAF